MHTKLRKPALSLLVALAAAVGFASHVPAATMPFSNDFSSTGFTNQSTSTGSNFTVGGGNLTWSTTETNLKTGTASELFDNMAGSHFTTSVQFEVTSSTPTGSAAVGFGVFASTSNFGSAAGQHYLLADFAFGSSPGTLRFVKQGSSGTLTGAVNGSALPTTVANTTFTLVLNAAHTTGNIYNMTLSLFDAAGTTQIGTSATATYTTINEPAGGFYHGLRIRRDNSSANTTVKFDNFSVVIPEPASLALLGIGGLLMLGRSRRRS